MIDWSKLRTAEQLQQEQLEAKQQQVRAEATRRIESRWDKNGQANVALGLYSDEQAQACRDWVNAHRLVVDELLADADLMNIDLLTHEGWPNADDRNHATKR